MKTSLREMRVRYPEVLQDDFLRERGATAHR